LSVKPTVELLNKLFIITFKISSNISIKVILDLVVPGTEENKDRVREDPMVDAVGISLLTENCCCNGVESTSKPTELHIVFFVRSHVMSGNFAILLGGI
jgi:hypothetical protein